MGTGEAVGVSRAERGSRVALSTLPRVLAMQSWKVALGLRGPWLASVTAGTQGKPRAWLPMGVNRNLTSRLGWAVPGKPMLGQAGNEPLLFWLWHLLPWAGL